MIGENKITYKYLNEDVFNNKINYSYSKFGGIEFLKSWEEKRDKCLDTLLKNNAESHKTEDDSNTNLQLERWLNNDVVFSELDKVHLLIKRFEVTKRIYEFYDADFRRINKDVTYDNLNLYINFGLVMVKLYDRYKHLQYLNSLLKLVDIICSRINELNQNAETYNYGAASKLLWAEKRIIKELCENKNIDL